MFGIKKENFSDGPVSQDRLPAPIMDVTLI